jgi:glycine/serine hydroxymethyltransferase
MPAIVDLIDRVINDFENESLIASVKAEVNQMMSAFPLFAY